MALLAGGTTPQDPPAHGGAPRPPVPPGPPAAGLRPAELVAVYGQED
jgi:hypothetical protein